MTMGAVGGGVYYDSAAIRLHVCMSNLAILGTGAVPASPRLTPIIPAPRVPPDKPTGHWALYCMREPHARRHAPPCPPIVGVLELETSLPADGLQPPSGAMLISGRCHNHRLLDRQKMVEDANMSDSEKSGGGQSEPTANPVTPARATAAPPAIGAPKKNDANTTWKEVAGKTPAPAPEKLFSTIITVNVSVLAGENVLDGIAKGVAATGRAIVPTKGQYAYLLPIKGELAIKTGRLGHQEIDKQFSYFIPSKQTRAFLSKTNKKDVTATVTVNIGTVQELDEEELNLAGIILFNKTVRDESALCVAFERKPQQLLCPVLALLISKTPTTFRPPEQLQKEVKEALILAHKTMLKASGRSENVARALATTYWTKARIVVDIDYLEVFGVNMYQMHSDTIRQYGYNSQAKRLVLVHTEEHVAKTIEEILPQLNQAIRKYFGRRAQLPAVPTHNSSPGDIVDLTNALGNHIHYISAIASIQVAGGVTTYAMISVACLLMSRHNDDDADEQRADSMSLLSVFQQFTMPPLKEFAPTRYIVQTVTIGEDGKIILNYVNTEDRKNIIEVIAEYPIPWLFYELLKEYSVLDVCDALFVWFGRDQVKTSLRIAGHDGTNLVMKDQRSKVVVRDELDMLKDDGYVFNLPNDRQGKIILDPDTTSLGTVLQNQGETGDFDSEDLPFDTSDTAWETVMKAREALAEAAAAEEALAEAAAETGKRDREDGTDEEMEP